MADRYVKLTCSWHDSSEWLQSLSCGGRLAWIQALVYCKTKGLKGVVKAPSLAHFARVENIPLEDVQSMVDAAVADGAIILDDGSWVFNNWGRYQGEDETNADRQRRFKERQKQASAGNSEQAVTDGNGVTNGDNTEERRGKDKKGEDNNPPTPLGGEPSKTSRTWKTVQAELLEESPEPLHEILSEWCEYKSERRDKPWTVTGLRNWLGQYGAWPPDRLTSAIRHTMANNWQGIVEPDPPKANVIHLNGRAPAITVEEAVALRTGEGLPDKGSLFPRKPRPEGGAA